MDRKKLINQIVARNRGVKSSEEYAQYTLDDFQPLGESAKVIMGGVPPTFGYCAMLSAAWAAYLKDNYNIPAIAVAGDLEVEKSKIFKCKKNIPISGNSKKDIRKTWNGHCWIEIDGFIGDLSLFRTAYSIPGESVLKSFVLDNFGQGRGALISNAEDLEDQQMKYIPKFVLTERQINGLIRGLDKEHRNI